MCDLTNPSFQDQSCSYRIVVRGQLDSSWTEWFDGMTITTSPDEAGNPLSTLAGPLPDQAALYGIIARLRDLGLTLLEIHQE
jgi:hypothetical protein